MQNVILSVKCPDIIVERWNWYGCSGNWGLCFPKNVLV